MLIFMATGPFVKAFSAHGPFLTRTKKQCIFHLYIVIFQSCFVLFFPVIFFKKYFPFLLFNYTSTFKAD